MAIQNRDLEHWKRHGYAVVESFLSDTELAAIGSELAALFPTWDQMASATSLYRNYPAGGHYRAFPMLGDALNAVAVHPDLLEFAERALATRNVMLTQSLVWAKYGGLEDYDQPLHADYMNQSLLYPTPDRDPDQVQFFIYYSDVDEGLGPTHVVSREHARDDLLVPYLRSRPQYPDLYAHERPVLLSAGSLLIYDTSVFHRGSSIPAPFRIRFAHHVVYRAELRSYLWSAQGLSAEMQHFVEKASPRERELLGIPAPEDDYWDESTLIGMAARYPGMDMTPYLAAAKLDPNRRETVIQRLTDLRAGPSLETGVVKSAPDPVLVKPAAKHSLYVFAIDNDTGLLVKIEKLDEATNERCRRKSTHRF
jgi:hypothetical protein